MLSNAGATAIGVTVSLIASAVDAVGLNLQRRDHLNNQSKPLAQQKPEYKRPAWFLGFFLYVGSQLFGSTGALYFLQPAVVACLGAAALIFNFLFASWLVKTVIHRVDVFGTFMIISGAVIVAVFGTIEKEEVTLDILLGLYGRPLFITYFTCLIVVAVALLTTTITLSRVVDQPAKAKLHVFKQMRPARLRKLVGFGFAVSGGMIASITVQLAETGVRLLGTTFGGQNQFYDGTSYVILIILVVSAVAQVFCMNSGLRICDSVTVVPVFFALYSVLSLINQNVYYDLWSHYGALNYALIVPAIFLLIYGVYMITASHAVDIVQSGAIQEDEEDSNWETETQADSQRQRSRSVNKTYAREEVNRDLSDVLVVPCIQ